MGGKVIFMRRCIFHWQFSIQYKQVSMKMTLPPMATATGFREFSISRLQAETVCPSPGLVHT
jgi:hypothetical protein